jgi:translation initiation factor 2 beta subunit (eIF-2beta)/eIF-5
MTKLKPCPECGKDQGKVIERAARFPYAVHCQACGWGTPYVKLRSIAEKLWNEANR